MIEIVGRRRFYNIANNLPKFYSWLYSQGNHILPSPIMPDSNVAQNINGVEQNLFPG